ncbi:MAG: hypothetical protein FWF82_04400 [Oscillospiraceae bacterium]|nr:hypothetical protein [Oscillospiraceae bacterium]
MDTETILIFTLVMLIPIAVAITIFVVKYVKTQKKSLLYHQNSPFNDCDILTGPQFKLYIINRIFRKKHLQNIEEFRQYAQQIPPESLTQDKRTELIDLVQMPIKNKSLKSIVKSGILFLGVFLVITIMSVIRNDINNALFLLLIVCLLFAFGFWYDYSEYKKLKKSIEEKVFKIDNNVLEVYTAAVSNGIIIDNKFGYKNYYIECGELDAYVTEEQFYKITNQLTFVFIINDECGYEPFFVLS